MPELPEVETIVRRLRSPLVGRTVIGVDVKCRSMVQIPDEHLTDRLPGQRIQDVQRRGKYVNLLLSGGDSLVVHLRMTGDLNVCSATEEPHRHDRVVFHLDNDCQLRFNDQRKLGRVQLIDNPARFFDRLGPEPLGDAFTEDDFLALFGRRSRLIKPLLLDQTFIAGVGNIYADESLFVAGIQPQRPADTLLDEEKRWLYQAIRQVLTDAIAHEGSSLSDETYKGGRYQDHFRVYGREGQPCSRCGSAIRRIRLGQRSSHFCPDCQQ